MAGSCSAAVGVPSSTLTGLGNPVGSTYEIPRPRQERDAESAVNDDQTSERCPLSHPEPFPRDHALRPPLRPSHARQEPCVFRRIRPVPRTRYRCQRDDLQLRSCPPPPPLSVSRARGPRGDRGVEPEARMAHELRVLPQLPELAS